MSSGCPTSPPPAISRAMRDASAFMASSVVSYDMVADGNAHMLPSVIEKAATIAKMTDQSALIESSEVAAALGEFALGVERATGANAAAALTAADKGI